MLKRSSFSLAVLLTCATVTAAPAYYVVVPVKNRNPAQSIGVALNAASLPNGEAGVPYPAVDLKNLLTVTGDPSYTGAGVTWSLASGALPEGLTLSADGVISGTPTAASSATISLRASYKTKSGQQSYSLLVVNITVSLVKGALPDALVRQTYAPFDFKSLLTVDGDPAYTATAAAFTATGLPAGLTISQDGILTGTPTAATPAGGASFTVLAAYRSKKGEQTYTIKVGATILTVTAISAGIGHTCAITTDGAATCWGDNAAGQLGDGSTTRRVFPAAVRGLERGTTSISAGQNYSCAVANGAAYCWGENTKGQLGNNSTVSTAAPVPVSGMGTGAYRVVTGTYHTCVQTTAGGAKCWGDNTYGQLGNRTTTSSLVPVTVTGLTLQRITLGMYHTCAQTTAGAAKCWGYNAFGQLGTGVMSYTANVTPVDVTGMSSGVTDIDAGSLFTCAVVSGAAKCWGANTSGQLGTGTSTDTYSPTAVQGLGSGVTTISAGTLHACAIAFGAVKCWGMNNGGQLGSGTRTYTTAPVATGLTGASGVTTGAAHSCAVLTTGGAKCWGAMATGIDGKSSSDTPADVYR